MAFNFKPNDFHKWAHLLFYKNEKKKKKHLSQIERYAKDGTLPNNSMRTCNGLEIRMQVVQKTNMRQPKPSITLSVKCKLNQC
jgi:hypothetical protein